MCSLSGPEKLIPGPVWIFSSPPGWDCQFPFCLFLPQAPEVETPEVHALLVTVRGDQFHSVESRKVMFKSYKPETFVQTDKPIYLPGQTGSSSLKGHSGVWKKAIVHACAASLSPFQGGDAGLHVQTCKRAGESFRTGWLRVPVESRRRSSCRGGIRQTKQSVGCAL